MKKINLFSKIGFSSIELIVGISISGMLLIGTMSLIYILFISNSQVTRLDQLEQAVNDVYEEIARSVRWSKITGPPDSTLDGEFMKVVAGDDSITVYKRNPTTNQLFKDTYNADLTPKSLNQPLTNTTIKVTNLILNNYSVHPSVVSYEFTLDLKHNYLPNVTKSFTHVISQRLSAL